MSRPLPMTVNTSRSNANLEIAKVLANETSDHFPTATSVIRSALTKTPHLYDDHHKTIAAAAYRRAEQRGFESGHDLNDWIAAESKLNQRLAGEGRAY